MFVVVGSGNRELLVRDSKSPLPKHGTREYFATRVFGNICVTRLKIGQNSAMQTPTEDCGVMDRKCLMAVRMW